MMMMTNSNWCSSRQLAEKLNLSNEEAMCYIDILRGKHVTFLHHTHRVKRMLGRGKGIIWEYVIDYPIELVLPLIKEEIK